MRLSPVMSLAAVLLAAARLGAQQPEAPPKPPPAPTLAAAPAHPPADEDGKFDAAAVERGRQLLVQQCGFCHGSNARGGQQGPDLTRSDLVQSDENGKQLGAFLKVGRPELKMPKFDLPEKDVVDLATFLHSEIQSVSDRGEYKILDIVVGDPKAGEAFFNGAGQVQHVPLAGRRPQGHRREVRGPGRRCSGRFVMPRGGRRGGAAAGGARETPPFLEPTAVKATVKPGRRGVRHGSPHPPHRLRRDRLRLGHPAAALVAAHGRNSGRDPDGSPAGARGHAAQVDGHGHPQHDGLPGEH